MCLKSALQKLKFDNNYMAKTISKGYTLDCSCKYPCTFPHSNTTLFLIKTILPETNNIFFSKNC